MITTKSAVMRENCENRDCIFCRDNAGNRRIMASNEESVYIPIFLVGCFSLTGFASEYAEDRRVGDYAKNA